MKNLIKSMMAIRPLQPLWERLNRLSLVGMNIGPGGDLRESGELWVLDHVAARAPARPVVFDVGANQGHYATAILDRFRGEVELHCFEPSAATFAILQRTLDARAGVRLNHFGLGATEERVALYSNQDGSGLASVYHRRLDHFGIDMKATESIRLRRLDDYCREQSIERIHFAKLDVEGHELSVLRGAKAMIVGRKIDYIQFEFGGCNIDSRTFFQDFFYELSGGYKIHRVLRRGLAAIDRYRETLESFTTTNYLAISRDLPP